MAIIRGTTPVLEITFADINVADLTVAALVIKQNNKAKIERDLTSATVGEASISWRLTQQETLGLESGKSVTIVCDWKLNNGTRGRSKVYTTETGEPAKNEVL